MKIYIHLAWAVSNNRHLFDQTPLCPQLYIAAHKKKAERKVLATIVQGASGPGTQEPQEETD